MDACWLAGAQAAADEASQPSAAPAADPQVDCRGEGSAGAVCGAGGKARVDSARPRVYADGRVIYGTPTSLTHRGRLPQPCTRSRSFEPHSFSIPSTQCGEPQLGPPSRRAFIHDGNSKLASPTLLLSHVCTALHLPRSTASTTGPTSCGATRRGSELSTRRWRMRMGSWSGCPPAPT